ncbi:hypothetical protein FISHEDRAFT_67378 [Fistulina hepatica ATCC 64428]|uniref:SURP motif domain-containing protein n=1 Tax=Fistulina hepatica ATCC 64428 TaxID=1128425 RepID=A0A0D7A431_9AGAR|nr:hypothetical protein FISHEDRAFT_67378 [Fistulina hepatica ATCC 64428]
MSSKRKRSQYHRSSKQSAHTVPAQPAVDHHLFIQAHEADIIQGPEAGVSARSLEIRYSDDGSVQPGSALIQWGVEDVYDLKNLSNACFRSSSVPADLTAAIFGLLNCPYDPDVACFPRYDARLFLECLPDDLVDSSAPPLAPPSPTGWSDLPSDTEDTFFLTVEEADDYRREKRRRLLDHSHEQRLRARKLEDGAADDPWGGSDEEPDEVQMELMRKTARHIQSAANSAQLEMRILANFGAEKKFAFLKGRWKRAWMLCQRTAKVERDLEARKEREAALAGLGGLADYSDSDAGDDNGSQHSKNDVIEDADNELQDTELAESVKAARRARLKEWLAQRRGGKADTSAFEE